MKIQAISSIRFGVQKPRIQDPEPVKDNRKPLPFPTKPGDPNER